MTAYWIATYDEVTDPDKVVAYANLAGPALMAAGGRFLARGNPEQVYELGEETRTVLIEFPSVEAARRRTTRGVRRGAGGAGRRPAVTSGSSARRTARRQRGLERADLDLAPARLRRLGRERSATSRSGTSMIQKPPMCSFDSG